MNHPISFALWCHWTATEIGPLKLRADICNSGTELFAKKIDLFLSDRIIATAFQLSTIFSLHNSVPKSRPDSLSYPLDYGGVTVSMTLKLQ